jgi:hypothetical protein
MICNIEKDILLFHKEGYVHTWEHQRMMHIQMVMVSDINRNRSGKWYGYGNSTCSAWLSYEGCTEEEDNYS